MAEIKCMNPWDIQSKHVFDVTGICEALYSGECRWGGGEHYVCYETSGQTGQRTINIQQMIEDKNESIRN